ncbi:MAG: LexA family transcriptional regulator [Candidatus Cloacimonetes bacterium]|nr:LexA family transcriptional regulator [Candidatus Cloacimonadota bacterium]
MSRKTIGDRLTFLIKTLGVKDYEFAEKYQISRASLIRYKQNERYPDPEFLVALSKQKVNLNWLLTGNGAMYIKDEFEEFIKGNKLKPVQPEIISPNRSKIDATEIDYSQSITMSIVGDIAAGEPIEIIDQYGMSGQIDIPRTYLKGNPQQYIVFQVNGKSMEPIIQHADIVVIKANPIWELANNQVAAVRTNDGITLKKIQIDRQRQQVILQPFNIDFPVLVLDSDWNSDASLIGTIALQLRFY